MWFNTMFHIYLLSKSTPTNLLQLLGMVMSYLYIIIVLRNQVYSPKTYQSCFSILSNYRNRREDNDGVEFESDSWSDDSGSDNLSRSLSNDSSKSWDAISEESSSDQEGSCQTKDKLGNLYLSYTEMSSPYHRVPLALKVLIFK